MSRVRLSEAGERTLQQLWGPALSSGAYRLDATASPGWDTIRSFTVAPSPRNPRMFIEKAPRRAARASLMSYPGLRTPRMQAARYAMAMTLASPGTRRHFSSFTLHRDRRATEFEHEPLTVAGSTLATDFFCHLGVRVGANSKPTAQLFDLKGQPLGYAKFSWDARTARDVLTEARRMRALEGISGAFRTPRVLSSGESFGRPFVITQPLPSKVKQLQQHTELSIDDLCSIAPRTRVDSPRSSRGLQLLADRLHALLPASLVRMPAQGLMSLIHGIRSNDAHVPIVSYDHGDLVPWNACRDDGGHLWVWDWESSIEDLPAGTDAIHWFVHSLHGPAPADLANAIEDAFSRAQPALTALGLSRQGAHLSAATYICLTIEKACSLAYSNDTWRTNRVDQHAVARLLALGDRHVVEALL